MANLKGLVKIRMRDKNMIMDYKKSDYKLEIKSLLRDAQTKEVRRKFTSNIGQTAQENLMGAENVDAMFNTYGILSVNISQQTRNGIRDVSSIEQGNRVSQYSIENFETSMDFTRGKY